MEGEEREEEEPWSGWTELIPGEFIQGQKEKQQNRDLQEVTSKHIRKKEG